MAYWNLSTTIWNQIVILLMDSDDRKNICYTLILRYSRTSSISLEK